MLTALLLLLGLSGAGAGLYAILKEPKEKPSGEKYSPYRSTSTQTQPKTQEKILSKDKQQFQPIESQKEEKSPQERQTKPKFPVAPKITYPVDEIISKNSKYSQHRRPLLNAEALVEKLKIQEAIEIYRRTKDRIPDPTIQDKISKNIQDLQDFQTAEKELDELWEGKTPPYVSGPIPLKDLAEAVREIAEALSESLSRGFYPPPQTSQSPHQAPLGELGGESRKLPPGYFPPPIVYQITSPIGPNFQAEYIPPTPVPETTPKPTQPLEKSFPIEKEFEKKEPEKIPNEDIWSLDLPDDTFFTKEWEKFKDLPLTDRRSGKERRQNKDRRSGPSRKDRRSGEDRRKVDLFKEREEYLRRKAEEKKKLREEGQKFPEKLEESLQAFWPPPLAYPTTPDLPKLDLPEPESKSLLTPQTNLSPLVVEELNLPNPIDIVLKEPTPIGKPELEPKIIYQEPPKPPEPPSTPEVTPQSPPLEPLPKINLPSPEDLKLGEEPNIPTLSKSSPGKDLEDKEPPEIEFVDEDLDEKLGEIETPETPEVPEEKEPEKIIHGVLELKPPEVDDAPFLTLTYDFSKIPDSFRLSKNYSIMEYSYYKYKPMLMKAQEFARRKMLKNALNYYRVIKSQNIPPEMRKMINRNIQDITEFMEKFLMAKGG